jgi:RHS repeat-associated protein
MSRPSRTFVWIGFFVCFVWCAVVLADDPGDRAFTALGGGRFGQSASVGAAGNLGISLPLRLPSPRGGLPLPLAVSYNGSNAIGAAGAGWDIPILGVTWQRNVSRRKPVHHIPATQADPLPADRIFLDVGSGPMLMAPTNKAGVYQPFGNGYYELTFVAGAFNNVAGAFNGRDAEGRLWVFQKLPALFNDDFFALVRIEDASGVNRVDLHYDVFDKFSPDPVVPPFSQDQLSARELVLREIAYAHDARGACPKYRVQLSYATAPSLLGLEIVAGRPRTRTHVLQRITLLSSRDTTCQAASVRSEAIYTIAYEPDPLTGQPRLTKVDMFGANDDGSDVSKALPVVAYTYGNPLVAGELQYGAAEHIALPAGPAGANTGLAATLSTGAGSLSGSLYGLVRNFQDLNGDGRLDFLTLNHTGANPVLAINRPSALGNDFSTLPVEVNLPNAPAAPYNLGAPDLAFNLPVVATINNTYQQVIDFNGDGRPDIIVATEGRNDAGDKDVKFWKVLINQPGPSGVASDILWLERHIDISFLRLLLRHGTPGGGQGHRLSPVASSDESSKPLPVERTHLAGAFANNIVVEGSVITQWKLLDVNGDGFPDFVFDSDGVTARNEQVCDTAGNCQQGIRQDHVPGNQLRVVYHTGPMMAGSGAETQNVWQSRVTDLRMDGACGLSRLVWLGGGMRQLQCGFMEANGDGLVDYVISDAAGTRVIRSSGLSQEYDVLLPENQIPADYAQQEMKRAIVLPGPVGLVKDPRARTCPSGAPGTRQYEIEQLSGLHDITGDGIADYIYFGGRDLPPGNPEGLQGWWFMAGTGVGFTAPRAVRSPDGIPFALHVSSERCDGVFSNVTASLLDLDGDGRPEIVRTLTPTNVFVAKLVNADGQLGAHSAGQIIAIDNRYGGVARISYGSAKSDWLGPQNVPFPQIVVTQIEQTAQHGLGTSLAPTRYAYGAPDTVYHPLLGRFVFRGYRRRVEVRGEPTSNHGMLKGTASISTSITGSEVTNDLDRLMLAGRPRRVRVVAGAVPADPRRLLVGSAEFDVETASVQETVWKTQALPGDVPILLPFEEECYATPSPHTPGVWGDLSLCRRAATAFVAEQATSEGPGPFPSLQSVATRTEVTTVDDFARPLQITSAGDRHRTDDDVCLQISYASPVPGAPRVLDAPRTVRAHECGNPSRVLSGERFRYDDLPDGQVRIGRASGSVLERYNVETATLIEHIPSGTLQRDVFGNPVEVQRSRADGATMTTQITWDPFGLLPVRSETGATGLAEPLVTEVVRDPHALLPLTVVNTHRAATHYSYDNFSRLERISLTLPGDPARYVLVDTALSGFDGSLGGRSVTYRVFHQWTHEADVANAPADAFTTYTLLLDEAGRQMHGIVELGPDYNGQSLIVDAVAYDELGRPRFAADPFPANVFGPRYGSTFTYQADGRLACVINGVGIQMEATTDETLDRYPTCTSYEYRDGQLLVQTRGPNEIATGKPQSGAYDERAISGTGQLLSLARVKGTAKLDLTEYGYDRLGTPAFMRRWAAPESASTKATWTWTNDSLGNVLVAHEPAQVARRLSYDDWGNVTAVGWTDSTGVVSLERGIHFAYDGLARLLRSHESINGEERTDTRREYFYDTPSGQPQHLDTSFLLGQLSFARTGGRTVFLGYDAQGRMTSVSQSDASPAFHVAQRSTLGPSGDTDAVELLSPGTDNPAEAITYAYDSARRLRAVEFKDAAGTSEVWRALQIDVFGRILDAQLGNGATEHFRYRQDGRRELQSQRVEAGGRTRAVQFAGYDGAMLLQGTSESSTITPMPPTVTQYTYDIRNALARATVRTPSGITRDFSYAYDGLGNLRSIIDAAGAGSLEIRPDKFDPDRICAVVEPGAPEQAPCTYRYDATGNVWQVQDTDALYDYDASGRLRSARIGARRAQMDYDPFGTLAALRVSDGEIERREHFYGAASHVAFFDHAGNPVTVGAPGATLHSFTERVIDSPVGTIAVVRRSNTGRRGMLYPVGDPQGTRVVLDEDAASTQAITYDAYGAVVADTGIPASLTWWPSQWNGGHMLEGLGLVALGQRVLDSRTGRFLQRDPVLNASSAVSAHPYAFAWNNPVTFVDVTGAEPTNGSDTASPILSPAERAAMEPRPQAGVGGGFTSLAAPPDPWVVSGVVPDRPSAPAPGVAWSVTARRLVLEGMVAAGLITNQRASSLFQDFITKEVYTNQKTFPHGGSWCAAAVRQMALKYAGVIRLGLSYGAIKIGLAGERSPIATTDEGWERWHFNETYKKKFTNPQQLYPEAIAQIARNALVGTGTSERLRWVKLTAEEARRYLEAGGMIAGGTPSHWMAVVRDPFMSRNLILDPYVDPGQPPLFTSPGSYEQVPWPLGERGWGEISGFHGLVRDY